MSSSTFAIGYTLKTLIDRLQGKIAPYGKHKLYDSFAVEKEELNETNIAMVAEDIVGDDWDEWAENDQEQEGEILTPAEISGIKEEIAELQRLYQLASSISSNKKGGLLTLGITYGIPKDGAVGSQSKGTYLYGEHPNPTLSETTLGGEWLSRQKSRRRRNS